MRKLSDSNNISHAFEGLSEENCLTHDDMESSRVNDL